MQQEFAFIPDDGSSTYVINVENNSTQPLAGPTSKDAKATYAASITALVQLDSTGAVSFLPYKQGDSAANGAAKWTSVAAVASVVPPGSTLSSGGSSSSSSGSGAAGSSGSGAQSSSSKSGTPSGTAAPSQTTGASQQTDAAVALGSGSQVFAGLTAAVLALSSLLL